jgi:hypothetical protein
MFARVISIWNIQLEATLRALTTFYDTGVADDSLFTYSPMEFKVKLGLPLVAKISLGIGIMFVMGIIFVITVGQEGFTRAEVEAKGATQCNGTSCFHPTT